MENGKQRGRRGCAYKLRAKMSLPVATELIEVLGKLLLAPDTVGSLGL